MGKLYSSLKKQLKTAYKEEAENCIKIYDKLKEIRGSVWNSEWETLTNNIGSVGTYPNSFLIYKPSEIGKLFLKGIEFEERMKESAEQSDDVL